MWTAWDARSAVRAFGMALAAFLLAWLVTAATDEGGVAWGARAGRTLPIAPYCAGLGALLSLLPARLRGEIRALETLGRAPWQNAAAAVAGGALAAWGAALAIGLVQAVDVTGFFPVAVRGGGFHFDGGGFVDPSAGWRVALDGHLTRAPVVAEASTASGVPAYGRASAAVATALAGTALPLIAAHALLTLPHAGFGGARRPTWAGSAWLVAGMSVATLVLFQASAAGQVPAPVAVIPAGLLLGEGLRRYGSAPWGTTS